eukprot:scaffold1169_cov120-Cylindrotheca_fusiformis.AAC.16
MSSNLNYKQSTNVSRRTWDLDTYEQRAKDRAAEADKPDKKKKKSKVSASPAAGDKRSLVEMEDDTHKEEFVPAVKGAAGPHLSKRAFLKARQSKVDVDSKVGTIEVINPEAVATTKATVGQGSAKDGITKTGVGWHCRVCDCFLKDSLTYLDHINGKKHQRNLGYSMRVERSTKDQVSSRLALLAKEKESTKALDETVEDEDFYDIVKAKDEEARRRKEERARQRKERKMMKKKKVQEPPAEEKEAEDEATQDVEEPEVDPALAAMMGFSGFGSGKKRG